MNDDKILIVYFSGTGSTTLVVDTLREAFINRSFNPITYPLDLSLQNKVVNDKVILEEVKLVLLVYPVHAFNAPIPIFEWIEAAPFVKSIPTVVLSVSGGGVIWPNTLCRVNCIEALEHKGFNVFYEEMLVMPSNFWVKTNDHLSMWLLEDMPKSVNSIVDDVIENKMNRTSHKKGIKFVNYISEQEAYCAYRFGLSLKVDNTCDGCGWCKNNCPRNNIEMVSGKPIFSNKCILCMRCIYGCPLNSIYSGKYNFIAIKEGYNISDIKKRMKNKELQPVKTCGKGWLWLGVRRYLSEREIK